MIAMSFRYNWSICLNEMIGLQFDFLNTHFFHTLHQLCADGGSFHVGCESSFCYKINSENDLVAGLCCYLNSCVMCELRRHTERTVLPVTGTV